VAVTGGSKKATDVLLVNPGSRAAEYQQLGGRYSAIEPPSLAGLFATYLRKRGLSVAINAHRIPRLGRPSRASPEESQGASRVALRRGKVDFPISARQVATVVRKVIAAV